MRAGKAALLRSFVRLFIGMMRRFVLHEPFIVRDGHVPARVCETGSLQTFRRFPQGRIVAKTIESRRLLGGRVEFKPMPEPVAVRVEAGDVGKFAGGAVDDPQAALFVDEEIARPLVLPCRLEARCQEVGPYGSEG